MNLERLKKANISRYIVKVHQDNKKIILKLYVWKLDPPEPLVDYWQEEIEKYMMSALRKELN